MNAQPYKTAVYFGVLSLADFAPAKLEELLSLAKRMALVVARSAEKDALRKELAPWYLTKETLDNMVDRQCPPDHVLEENYDLKELARDLNYPPYRLRFTEDGKVIVQRSSYFTFAPASGELASKLPGSKPCFALPAEWLVNWSKPLYHVTTVNHAMPSYAWRPARSQCLVKA